MINFLKIKRKKNSMENYILINFYSINKGHHNT